MALAVIKVIKQLIPQMKLIKAQAEWFSSINNWRSYVRIPPGCEVFMTLYSSMQLFVT
jgi:hypothetical protein